MARMTLPTEPRVSGHESDGEEDGGDRHDAVHHTHDHRIGSADEAGDEADGEPADGGEDGHREADDQRDAGAIEDTRIDVAAEHVGAEPELRRRLAGAQPGRDGGRIAGAEIGREDSHQEDGGENRRTDDDGGVTAQQEEEPAAAADGRSPAPSAAIVAAAAVSGLWAVNSGSSDRRAYRRGQRRD